MDSPPKGPAIRVFPCNDHHKSNVPYTASGFIIKSIQALSTLRAYYCFHYNFHWSLIALGILKWMDEVGNCEIIIILQADDKICNGAYSTWTDVEQKNQHTEIWSASTDINSMQYSCPIPNKNKPRTNAHIDIYGELTHQQNGAMMICSVWTAFKIFIWYHYIDVMMPKMACRITSLTVVYSTVYSDADQRKHHSSVSLAFVWGIHRDRCIPRTKGQLRGKCFHSMTSSWHTKACTVYRYISCLL